MQQPWKQAACISCAHELQCAQGNPSCKTLLKVRSWPILMAGMLPTGYGLLVEEQVR